MNSESSYIPSPWKTVQPNRIGMRTAVESCVDRNDLRQPLCDVPPFMESGRRRHREFTERELHYCVTENRRMITASTSLYGLETKRRIYINTLISIEAISATLNISFSDSPSAHAPSRTKCEIWILISSYNAIFYANSSHLKMTKSHVINEFPLYTPWKKNEAFTTTHLQQRVEQIGAGSHGFKTHFFAFTGQEILGAVSQKMRQRVTWKEKCLQFRFKVKTMSSSRIHKFQWFYQLLLM